MSNLVFLGDEDRAATHATKGMELLASSPMTTMHLSDGTVLEKANGVVYINSPMLPEHYVLSYRNLGDAGIFLETYGYAHRKDAMIPNGRVLFTKDWTAFGYPSRVAPEVQYISDGMVGLGIASINWNEYGGYLDPMHFVATVSLPSINEDLITDFEGEGTVAAAPSSGQGFEGVVAYGQQTLNLYALCPYGVNRANGTYSIAIGYQSDVGYPMIDTYDNAVLVRQKKVTEINVGFVDSRRDVGVSPYYYTLGYGQVVYYELNTSYEQLRTPYPILFPLGNNRIVAFYFTVNQTTELCTITAKLIDGSSHTMSAVSTAGITSGWFSNTPFIMETGIPTLPDYTRQFFMFSSLALTSRCPAPLTADETLCMYNKLFLTSNPDDHWEQVVAMSITPSAITNKGVIFGFNNDAADNTVIRHQINKIGMLVVGDGVVYAYLRMYIAPIGYDVFLYHGIVRFVSEDSGTTWDAGTVITIDWTTYDDPTEHDNPEALQLSTPVLVTNADGVNVVAFAVNQAYESGTDLIFDSVGVIYSTDDGVTFVRGPKPVTGLNYVYDNTPIPDPGNQNYMFGNWTFSHVWRGAGSLQHWGNHEDGYAPSPYRHLPTYYGAPTKASRNSTTDPNL